MLIPVRVVVEIYKKLDTQGRWYVFYKDIELPISIFHTPHIVRLFVGTAFCDFKLNKEKLPLCIGGVERVVLHLDTMRDQSNLVENLKQTWSELETVLDAENFVKTPEAPKIKRAYKKKEKYLTDVGAKLEQALTNSGITAYTALENK